MKNEMYYGYEKEYTSFEIFDKAVEEYIDYYNNIRIQAKNKMDASCKIQRSIHVFNITNKSMCPDFWVHINRVAGFSKMSKSTLLLF